LKSLTSVKTPICQWRFFVFTWFHARPRSILLCC